jgi:glycosyltransferase involved in cell wall biosynthesis
MRTHEFCPDVMATFGVPMSDHLLGLRLKAKFGLPWIAHFSDPWVDNAFHRNKVLANIVNRRLERQVISAADQLVFTSSETLDLVMRKYPSGWRAKTNVLPHSYDPALYSTPAPHPGGPVLRYLGNFYGHRTPIPLFRALRSILDHEAQLLDNVRIELVGQLPRRMRLHPALRSLPAGLVRLVNTVPYSQSLRLMSDADLLLVIDAPDDLSVFLPSKLIEYLGSGTPIFGIVPPGTSARLLARVGALVADPRKPEEIVERLRQALHLVWDRRAAADRSEWGKAEVRAEFHVDRVRHAFLEILQAVSRRSSSS